MRNGIKLIVLGKGRGGSLIFVWRTKNSLTPLIPVIRTKAFEEKSLNFMINFYTHQTIEKRSAGSSNVQVNPLSARTPISDSFLSRPSNPNPLFLEEVPKQS